MYGVEVEKHFLTFSYTSMNSLTKTPRCSVGLLDADVFGPSIPLMMNISDTPETNHQKLIIPVSNYNIKCMSMGLLVDEESPVS